MAKKRPVALAPLEVAMLIAQLGGPGKVVYARIALNKHREPLWDTFKWHTVHTDNWVEAIITQALNAKPNDYLDHVYAVRRIRIV